MSNCLTHKRSRLGPANNIGFLKTYNTEFDKIIITFTQQNGRPLEIEGKVNLTLLVNKWKLQALQT